MAIARLPGYRFDCYRKPLFFSLRISLCNAQLLISLTQAKTKTGVLSVGLVESQFRWPVLS